jgi:hypothetical protein
MKHTEARTAATQALEAFRGLDYSTLVARLVDQVEIVTAATSSGQEVEVEVEGLWDDRKNGNVRVMASVSTGLIRTASDDFIKAPDGRFIDEPESL